MSRFLQKLTALLDEAMQQDVIDQPTHNKLRELAEDRERSGGVLSLAAVLGWLGAGILVLGVILLISANWSEIPPFAKLTGFFALFLGVHGGGLYLRKQNRMPWFAESLGFLGAGLFLAGIGLISQIYQVEGRPSVAVLIWLIAIAPLAWCFRSAPVTLLSLFALLLWLHMEQFGLSDGGRSVTPASTMVVEVGLGAALIGFAAALRDREPTIAWTFRGSGLLLLFYSVYMLGFYRHLSASDWNTLDAWAAVPPGGTLVFGVIGLGVGYPWMLPDNRYLRDRLVILLALLLGLAAAILLADMQVIPRGPDIKVFDFGWYRTFHATEWILSVLAWFLWFGLALWCVVFASRTGRRAYLNAGVLAVGLGVITRFFDLMGGLFETGLAFVAGGTVLLATCFAVEYWRRTIVSRLKDADVRQGAKK